MSEEQVQENSEQVETLTDTEFGLDYIDKRTDKGLSPGVSAENVQKHQQVNPKDPGLPRAGEILNERPKTDEEKAKIAEAEAIEAANKEAEAKAEEKTEETKTEQVDTEAAEYVSYNDPAADAAVELLKEEGVTPQEAAKWFAPVLESMDINKMDIAAMEAKLGKAKAGVVAAAVKDYYTRQAQTIQTTAKAVTEVFGGDENLGKIRNWVNTLPDNAEEKGQVAELLKLMNQGEYSAKLAAKELRALYEKHPNNKSLSIKRVDGDGVSAEQTKILTRQEYHAEMKKAQANGDKQRIAELRQNRARAYQ